MDALARDLDDLAAATAFSGVVRVDRGGDAFERAYGLADRRWEIANTVDTRFGIASGTKFFTALTVMTLVAEGVLGLETPVRALLRDDLPLIRDDVTVEHLLAHRSGIGDYYDEEVETDFDSFELPVPVNKLTTTSEYLAVLDGHPTKFAPGERFSYSNGGYVVLALVAERAAGIPFHELVVERVCAPAGLRDTAFFRSDQLPGRTAVGYVDVDGEHRSNVFHLPVRGSGDGGLYTTVGDVHALWDAFVAGVVVSTASVDEMTRTRGETDTVRCGLGAWRLLDRDAYVSGGADAGVSFRTLHDPAVQLTWTVVSNTSAGAWPLAQHLVALPS